MVDPSTSWRGRCQHTHFATGRKLCLDLGNCASQVLFLITTIPTKRLPQLSPVLNSQSTLTTKGALPPLNPPLCEALVSDISLHSIWLSKQPFVHGCGRERFPPYPGWPGEQLMRSSM